MVAQVAVICAQLEHCLLRIMSYKSFDTGTKNVVRRYVECDTNQHCSQLDTPLFTSVICSYKMPCNIMPPTLTTAASSHLYPTIAAAT